VAGPRSARPRNSHAAPARVGAVGVGNESALRSRDSGGTPRGRRFRPQVGRVTAWPFAEAQAGAVVCGAGRFTDRGRVRDENVVRDCGLTSLIRSTSSQGVRSSWEIVTGGGSPKKLVDGTVHHGQNVFAWRRRRA